MPSIGLVLSAGGGRGRAYHAGTLTALAEATAWDPRRADLIVGTSAGSYTGALLRAGVAPADDYAHHIGAPPSPEGQALFDRVRPFTEPDLPRPDGRTRLLRPALALRALSGRAGLVTGLAGLAPRGARPNLETGSQIADLAGRAWPDDPLWVCVVRVRDGQRVVFGRDDVTTPDLPTAVRASCAVPRAVEPVRVGNDDYVDGGTHSSTNADLVAMLGFDLVVVVSSMTAVPSASRRGRGSPGIPWYSRVLRREVEAIRALGTEVLVVQPTRADLHARRGGRATLAVIARQALRSALDNLDRPAAARARDVLRAAAYVPEQSAG